MPSKYGGGKENLNWVKSDIHRISVVFLPTFLSNFWRSTLEVLSVGQIMHSIFFEGFCLRGGSQVKPYVDY